ncbi:hypothetical protein [Cellulomonas iranensis]|uniref:hypothetical protein n=1 Tax=Cellulomonas iranensis TaxID=76862 RepID=UPI003D7CC147
MSDEALAGIGERLEEPGSLGVSFDQSQIDQMFKVRFMQPPRSAERDPSSQSGVTLTGDARVLVGEPDLGPDVGMDVLVRGLEAADNATLRGNIDQDPQVQPEVHQGTSKRSVLRDDEARQCVMTIDEAAARWDELRPRVELWERVVLTQDGRRAAVIVAWDWWPLHRQRMASLESAYWTHWQSVPGT